MVLTDRQPDATPSAWRRRARPLGVVSGPAWAALALWERRALCGCAHRAAARRHPFSKSHCKALATRLLRSLERLNQPGEAGWSRRTRVSCSMSRLACILVRHTRPCPPRNPEPKTPSALPAHCGSRPASGLAPRMLTALTGRCRQARAARLTAACDGRSSRAGPVGRLPAHAAVAQAHRRWPLVHPLDAARCVNSFCRLRRAGAGRVREARWPRLTWFDRGAGRAVLCWEGMCYVMLWAPNTNFVQSLRLPGHPRLQMMREDSVLSACRRGGGRVGGARPGALLAQAFGAVWDGDGPERVPQHAFQAASTLLAASAELAGQAVGVARASELLRTLAVPAAAWLERAVGSAALRETAAGSEHVVHPGGRSKADSSQVTWASLVLEGGLVGEGAGTACN
jgi:hypothetical protein